MTVELWQLDKDYALYVENRRIIYNIERSRNWPIMAEYYKYDRLVARQYRVPASEGRSARHYAKAV